MSDFCLVGVERAKGKKGDFPKKTEIILPPLRENEFLYNYTSLVCVKQT
jgi:hypothetical protein